jgi:sodium/hydrogen exchanger-like protein 6/7/sodium/hydrogen exchanger 8
MLEMAICFVSRATSMAILSGITIAIKGAHKWRLTFWDLNIIWFAGLIRGSIAYALIQQIKETGEEHHEGNEIL